MAERGTKRRLAEDVAAWRASRLPSAADADEAGRPWASRWPTCTTTLRPAAHFTDAERRDLAQMEARRRARRQEHVERLRTQFARLDAARFMHRPRRNGRQRPPICGHSSPTSPQSGAASSPTSATRTRRHRFHLQAFRQAT
jgi:hypothetical protein